MKNASCFETLVRYAGRGFATTALEHAQGQLKTNENLDQSEIEDLEAIVEVCQAWLGEESPKADL